MKCKLNKRMVVIIILFILLIAAIITTIFANARYQSTLRGTGTASIAKWSFKLVDADTQTTDVIDLAVTRTDGSDKVEEGKMAPGTYGEIEIGIDARGTEVALEYTIDVSLGNLPRNLIFYSDSAKTEVIEAENSIITKVGEMTLEEVNEIRTEKIYWDWPYQTGETESEIITNNQEDTEDSGKDVTMQIKVTGVQIMETLVQETVFEKSYSGQVEEFIVPTTGTYKLEVWGAQGGTNLSGEGGAGGYSYGNIKLSKNQTVYIVVGSQPTSTAGGYNGGGTGIASYGGTGFGGGGATHIATSTGNLSELSENQETVLIVAGGGGGGSCASQDNIIRADIGGAGGGESGTSGTTSGSGSGTAGTGATQTTGYLFGQGGNGSATPTKTTNWSTGVSHTKYGCAGGGGGGYYGGTGGNAIGASSTSSVGARSASGGGGSGYIGGVTAGETIAGNLEIPTHDGTSTMTGNTGNGYAKITLISY